MIIQVWTKAIYTPHIAIPTFAKNGWLPPFSHRCWKKSVISSCEKSPRRLKSHVGASIDLSQILGFPPTGHDKNRVKMTPFIRRKTTRSGILRFQILRQTPIMLFGALDPSSLSLPRLLAEPGVENGAAEGGTLFNASKSGEIICQPRQRWSKCTSYTVHSYIIDIDAVKALHEDPRSKKEINMEKKGLERSNAFHKPRFTPEP